MTTLEAYLKKCLSQFREVTEKKYGTPCDFALVETSVAPLGHQRPLTYEELRVFESPDQVWFQKHWVLPPERHVTRGLKDRSFDFRRLPNEEADLIASLLGVFKSIELVSIILRFVKPENYGIISPPVEKILDVRRKSGAVKTYLNYLKDLRSVRRHYHFERTADADMALWVLHERFSGIPDNPIWKAYETDPFMLRLRAKNLMDHFLTSVPDAELANSLVETNLKLAAQIAGIAFERMVRRQVPRGRQENWDNMDLSSLIEELCSRGFIDRHTREKWHEARRIRNKAIHDEAEPPRPKVERLPRGAACAQILILMPRGLALQWELMRTEKARRRPFQVPAPTRVILPRHWSRVDPRKPDSEAPLWTMLDTLWPAPQFPTSYK